jgi:hypothetical protein
MQPIAIPPTDVHSRARDLTGAIITRELRVGKTRFRKGQRITADDMPVLAESDLRIHAVLLDPDDVHEDEAAVRLAELLRGCGDGIMQRPPVQSRVNLIATRKGLLRVNTDALLKLNMRPELGVFTAPTNLPVVAGKIVAGAKISQVAIDRETMEDVAFEIGALPRPVIEVLPFQPLVAGVVITEGKVDKVRDRFETAVRQKVGWYGGSILRFEYVADEADAVANAMRSQLADGATILLAAGGHMMDPLDATQNALDVIGARMIRMGAPAHPGSMFWLGHLDEGDVPIVSLASCSMYSRSTVADLVLPRLFAGQRVTSNDLAALGHGGLLDRDMGWRFPPYDVDTVDEPDEDA